MRSPKRVRLSRQRGWRLPEGAVVVSRPSPWGNPHRIGPDLPRTVAVERFRDDLVAGRLAFGAADVQRELADMDLACWCPLDEPCHADVLLDVAAGHGISG